MKYLFQILFFGLFSISTFAQLNQVAQVELLKDSKFTENISVLPLAKKGMLLTLEKEGYFNKSVANWTFFRYDENLKERWQTVFEIERGYESVISYQNENYLFWLFAEPESPKINIIRLNLEHGEIDEFKGSLLGNVDIEFFKVLENTAFLGGTYYDKPIVISFSFFHKKGTVLHGLYDNHLEINGLEVDDKRNEINVIVKERRKRTCGLAIQSYSLEGKSLRTLHVPDENGNSLSFISGKMLPLNDKETLLVGNFSNNCNEFSKGLYLTRLEEGIEKGTSIIKFGDLKNFFAFMSPKRQEKMKEKIEQKKREGKEPNFSYKLLVHNLIETEKGSLLLAEIYYSQPRNNSVVLSSPFVNRSANRNYQEQYHFTHAVICEFDKTGKILWDNALVMDNLETDDLVEQIQVSKLDDKWLLAFLKKGKVNLQQIKGSEHVGEKEEFELKADDKSKPDEEAEVAAWYDQNFITWGTRKIENRKSDDTPKEAFYIRKLSYQKEKTGMIQGAK
jgi:hypothetical protein